MTIQPRKIANDINQFLDIVYATDADKRFPIDIINVAKEWSKKECPDNPILNIGGADLDCEGLLDNSNGWNILYSTKLSHGRQRFTIAHEFGHYLLHRQDLESGIIRCDSEALDRWGSDENNRENQANIFASWLLMPANDYREQLKLKSKNLETFIWLANRYGTSLPSTALKFLEITEEKALVVLSKDGFIKWARSSKQAMFSKKIIKASKTVIAIPNDSLAATRTKNLTGIHKDSGGWFNNSVAYDEMNLPQNNGEDLTILILDSQDYPSEDNANVVRVVGGKRTIIR